MTTISVQLPDDILVQLNRVSARSGLSPGDYVAETLREHLADLDDLAIAEQRLDDLLAGRTTAIPLEEVMRRYGLDS